jgi:hypothetical protein
VPLDELLALQRVGKRVGALDLLGQGTAAAIADVRRAGRAVLRVLLAKPIDPVGVMVLAVRREVEPVEAHVEQPPLPRPDESDALPVQEVDLAVERGHRHACDLGGTPHRHAVHDELEDGLVLMRQALAARALAHLERLVAGAALKPGRAAPGVALRPVESGLRRSAPAVIGAAWIRAAGAGLGQEIPGDSFELIGDAEVRLQPRGLGAGPAPDGREVAVLADDDVTMFAAVIGAPPPSPAPWPRVRIIRDAEVRAADLPAEIDLNAIRRWWNSGRHNHRRFLRHVQVPRSSSPAGD